MLKKNIGKKLYLKAISYKLNKNRLKINSTKIINRFVKISIKKINSAKIINRFMKICIKKFNSFRINKYIIFSYI